MNDAMTIASALRSSLPTNMHDEVAYLARIFVEVIDGILTPEKASAQIQATPALLQSIRGLDTQTFNTQQSLIHLGEASQTGDIMIRDLVGGHQISLVINLAPSPPSPGWSHWAAFGALVALIAALILPSYTLPLAPSIIDASTGDAASVAIATLPAATLSAAAVAAVPDRSSHFPSPLQPTLTAQLSTPFVQPTSAAKAFAEGCTAKQQTNVADERIFLMEVGTKNFILGQENRHDQPIALALSENGQLIAVVILDMVLQSRSYIARTVLDAGCEPLPDSYFRNDEASRLHMLEAWDDLVLCLPTGSYRIRVGAPNHTPVEMLAQLIAQGASCPS